MSIPAGGGGGGNAGKNVFCSCRYSGLTIHCSSYCLGQSLHATGPQNPKAVRQGCLPPRNGVMRQGFFPSRMINFSL